MAKITDFQWGMEQDGRRFVYFIIQTRSHIFFPVGRMIFRGGHNGFPLLIITVGIYVVTRF